MRDVVIAGAGMAGLHAAEALRAAGYDGRITMIGAEEHRPYSRPPLSKEILTGTGAGKGVRLREDAEFDALDLDLRLGRPAARLLPRERAVELDDGTSVRGGAVIIATGASARRPAAAPAGVHVLRTIADAEAVRAAFGTAGRIAVVGAGFVGAEVAASARAAGLEAVLIEAAPTPLTRSVDPRVGSVLTGLHTDHGVQVRLGVGVTGFEGTDRVEAVRLADGDTVEAPLVVAGLGVDLNTGWLAGSGVRLNERDGAVLVDAHGRTSVPGVYAAGDLAEFPHPLYGERMRLEHWTNAGEQAESAARNLLAGGGPLEPYSPVPYFWSDQYGMKIQLLGRAAPADTVEFVHGSPEDRKFVAFFGRGGLLTGVMGLRSTPKTMRYRRLLAERTSWDAALEAAGFTPRR